MIEKTELEKRGERFLQFLPDTDDLTLVVLKGHLLIEEQLNDILAKKSASPDYLENVRLGFYQKIQLIKALYGINLVDKDGKQPWESLESLNTIRNKLSHHLEPKNLEQVIENFVNSFGVGGSDFKCKDQENTSKTLRQVLCFLSGFIGVIGET